VNGRGLPEDATAPLVDSSAAERWSEWASGRGKETLADPYYSEARARFEIRERDVLRSVGDVVVRPAACGISLSSERARARFDVCGVSPSDASALFGAIDGARTTSEVRTQARVSEGACRSFWERTFGVLVLAPEAVSELDQRASAAEIVRYPGSPYEIVRAYWANMGDVADRVAGAGSELDTTTGFVRLLRELNVLALAGAEGRSFYLPASPIAARGRVRPGELWLSESVLEQGSGSELRFVSGPRVNASPIGGVAHQRLLSASLGDAEATSADRDFADPTGLSWGRLVVARADGDERAARWFCPPRPLDGRHLEALSAGFRAARGAAESGNAARVVTELASFHQRFIRIHPFRAGNQCLAMGLVNHVLGKSHGAGIPHLVLDHLALQLSPDAYARAFAIAVLGWLVAGKSPVERQLELLARKARCFDFLRNLGKTDDHDGALALVRARPDDAQLAFIDAAALP
jgi:hypothetical protein